MRRMWLKPLHWPRGPPGDPAADRPSSTTFPGSSLLWGEPRPLLTPAPRHNHPRGSPPPSPISGRSLPRWGQECPCLTSVPRRRLGRDHTRQRCARGAAQGEVMVTPAQACREHWGHPACKCFGAWTRRVVGSGRP